MKTPRRRKNMKIPALTALLAGAALTLAACGGAASGTTAGGTGSGGGTANAGGTPPASGAGLHVASTSLGKVLVDQNGMTVYLLTADGRDQSTCGTDCLNLWPAVTPGHSKLPVPVATTKTPAGTPTATVAGVPVYTFANDHGPGDVNGEGISAFGGTWYAVSATGQAVTVSGGASSGGSSPSSSGGSAPYGGGGY
jgi:predicted lipoprotein with Yx(FWY)xxD motif